MKFLVYALKNKGQDGQYQILQLPLDRKDSKEKEWVGDPIWEKGSKPMICNSVQTSVRPKIRMHEILGLNPFDSEYKIGPFTYTPDEMKGRKNKEQRDASEAFERTALYPAEMPFNSSVNLYDNVELTVVWLDTDTGVVTPFLNAQNGESFEFDKNVKKQLTNEGGQWLMNKAAQEKKQGSEVKQGSDVAKVSPVLLRKNAKPGANADRAMSYLNMLQINAACGGLSFVAEAERIAAIQADKKSTQDQNAGTTEANSQNSGTQTNTRETKRGKELVSGTSASNSNTPTGNSTTPVGNPALSQEKMQKLLAGLFNATQGMQGMQAQMATQSNLSSNPNESIKSLVSAANARPSQVAYVDPNLTNRFLVAAENLDNACQTTMQTGVLHLPNAQPGLSNAQPRSGRIPASSRTDSYDPSQLSLSPQGQTQPQAQRPQYISGYDSIGSVQIQAEREPQPGMGVRTHARVDQMFPALLNAIQQMQLPVEIINSSIPGRTEISNANAQNGMTGQRSAEDDRKNSGRENPKSAK